MGFCSCSLPLPVRSLRKNASSHAGLLHYPPTKPDFTVSLFLLSSPEVTLLHFRAQSGAVLTCPSSMTLPVFWPPYRGQHQRRLYHQFLVKRRVSLGLARKTPHHPVHRIRHYKRRKSPLRLPTCQCPACPSVFTMRHLEWRRSSEQPPCRASRILVPPSPRLI